MLKTRVIPVLLLRQGRMVKGKQFANYRDVGDPVSAARIYNAQNADELVFLDIEASGSERSPLTSLIEQVSRECFMPLSVGGGIRTVDEVRELLMAGADKVVITTAAVERPELIDEASAMFGKQCVIVGIDAKREKDDYVVYTHSGKVRTDLRLEDHILDVQARGAGEIFLNSIDRDGMMQGYDGELLHRVSALTSLPVIACGGAGTLMDLVTAIKEFGVHAVACASVFHFGDNNPVRARSYMKNHGIAVKNLK